MRYGLSVFQDSSCLSSGRPGVRRAHSRSFLFSSYSITYFLHRETATLRERRVISALLRGGLTSHLWKRITTHLDFFSSKQHYPNLAGFLHSLQLLRYPTSQIYQTKWRMQASAHRLLLNPISIETDCRRSSKS